MRKVQQKWIAVSVIACLAWLLHVSAAPLAASSAANPTIAAEQGPGFHEAIGQKAAPAKKKSILPWVLIGVGVLGATAAVLFLFVLKSYDLTGTWTFVFDGPTHETFTLTFSGDRKSGTFKFDAVPIYFGTYSVKDKDFTLTLTNFPQVQFSGRFTDKDALSGDWIANSDHWTFTATRNASAITADPAPASHSQLLAR